MDRKRKPGRIVVDSCEKDQDSEVVGKGKGERLDTVVDRGDGAREISRHGRIHRRLARAARLSSSGARNR